jgi:hypothetical protein
MATFRFGNGRSIARKYAFKFNLKATLYSSPFSLGEDTNTWQLFTFSVGAEVKFVSLSGDDFRGLTPAITNSQLGENSGPANFFYDASLGKYFIPFIYTVIGAEGTSKFYLEEFGGPDKNDPDIDYLSWLGKNKVTAPYTQAEADILKQAYKLAGANYKDLNHGDMNSKELSSTNTVSPVSNWNKTK